MLKKIFFVLLCAACMLCFISATFRGGSITGLTEYTDVSEFVVGTFAEPDGTRWHFDGTSAVTITDTGSKEVGYYHFLENTKNDAVLLLGFDGLTEVYEFELSSSGGSFVLTGSDKSEMSFTPVHIQ